MKRVTALLALLPLLAMAHPSSIETDTLVIKRPKKVAIVKSNNEVMIEVTGQKNDSTYRFPLTTGAGAPLYTQELISNWNLNFPSNVGDAGEGTSLNLAPIVGKPTEHVVEFGKRLPQEKVYLHLDNQCYFMGDTLWYKAYVTRSDNNHVSDISHILYVELFTPDGYLVERQQVPLGVTGNGFGAFHLQDSLYSGFYELRAYTRWQLNFGQYERETAFRAKERFYTREMGDAFFRDYEKLYSRVFPVYDKPSVEGEYSKLMTTRAKRRYFTNEQIKVDLKTTFYPEGGNLVEGLSSRVAFECVDNEGKHIKTTGVVRDQAGNEVVQFETSFRGRGTFELPASTKSGHLYTAEIVWKDKKYSYKLPEVHAAGCVVRLEEAGENIRVQLTSNNLDPVSATTLQATVMCGGKVSATLGMALDTQGEGTYFIPKAQLSTGVNNITVFDYKGEIFADRLFFINHQEYERTKVVVSGLKEEYAPHEPIELTFQLKDNTQQAEFSLAVRDRVTEEGTFDNSTILTEMLLGSEIKGFVESPAYYFEDNDAARRAHLDLLLMVQGWRRYVWRDMAGLNEFGLSHLPEKFQTLEGSVHKLFIWNRDHEWLDIMKEHEQLITDMESSAMGQTTSYDPLTSERRVATSNLTYETPEIGLTGRAKLKHEVDVTAEFVTAGDVEINDQTTTKGFFKLYVPPYFGESITFLSGTKVQTDKNDSKSKRKRKLAKKQGEEAVPEYYVKRDLFYPLFVKPYSFYQENIPEHVTAGYGIRGGESTLNDVQWLDQVTIRTARSGLRSVDFSKPAYVIDAYEMYNNIVDRGLSGSYFYGGREFDMGTTTDQIFGQMGFYDQIAYYFCADMGRQGRGYMINKRLNGKSFNELRGGTPNPYFFANGEIETDCRLRRMDKIYIYTDYEPRNEGSWKYEGSNIPEVIIDIKLFDGRRVQPTYKDRRYVLPGYTDCAEFYSPDYSEATLPEVKDYRRTLYWNPVVKTDSEGKATIRLYNNSRNTEIQLSAEGITQLGVPVVME